MAPVLGIVVADTRFRRLPGDVGSAASYSYPVRIGVARGIKAADLVTPNLKQIVLRTYIDSAIELEREGVGAITTTCGFLVPFQRQIAAELSVPFVASSLLQVPLVHTLIQRRIGIITANAEALTPMHLEAAGIQGIPVAIVGLETFEAFAAPILRDEGEADFDAIECAVVSAAEDLLRRYPDIGAIVCECHNLPSFGFAIQSATGRPVFDALSLLAMVVQAASKPRFAGCG